MALLCSAPLWAADRTLPSPNEKEGFVYFSAESHTDSARYTLTERTGAHINSRHLIHIGVSL